MTTLTYTSNGASVVVTRDQKVITMSSRGYIPRLDVKLPEFEAGLLARLYEIHGTTKLKPVNFPHVIYTWLRESNFGLNCWLTKTDLEWKLSGDDGFHVLVPYGEAPLFPHTNLRVPRPIIDGEIVPAPQEFKEYYDKIAFVKVSSMIQVETFDANRDKLFTWTMAKSDCQLPQPPSYEEISRLFNYRKIHIFGHPSEFGLSPWIRTDPFFIEQRDDGIHLYNGGDDTAALVVTHFKT